MWEVKKTTFLDVPLTVMLGKENEKAPSRSGHNDTSSGGVFYDEEDKELKIYFKGLVKDYVLIHEVYHCFCAAMILIGDQSNSWEEVTKEIYAYNFHSLYNLVLETVTTMKSYKKMWKEKDTI